MIEKYGGYLSEKEESNYYEMAFHEALKYEHRSFLNVNEQRIELELGSRKVMSK